MPAEHRAALSVNPAEVRKTVLGMLYRGQASHLGSNMSVIEMLLAVYSAVDLDQIRRRAPDRSRIIISKGHCAAATYATLAHVGLLDPEALQHYHQDGSQLAGHVSHAVPAVEHSTGALGHGLSVAVGCALGLRSRGWTEARVFAIVGDGELQEGSIWEAVMLARQLKLSNLILLVDNNRISSITRTEQVLDLQPLARRFAGFGHPVREVDGHDLGALQAALAELQQGAEGGVVIGNTVKGRGVPFAEWEPIWHYRSLNQALYEQALAQLDQEPA